MLWNASISAADGSYSSAVGIAQLALTADMSIRCCKAGYAACSQLNLGSLLLILWIFMKNGIT